MSAEVGATTHQPPDDATLLQAHVDGDREAFGVLFARHRERLWAVALRTTGNPDDAADGLQDGMIAAYRRAETYRGDAQVTTWLHRVVVNACLDRMRSARTRRTEPLPDDLEEHGARGATTQATQATEATGDPAEHSVRRERRDQVLTALRTLAPEQRAALVLVDMEGYPVAEAAEILDCAVGTVKSRCSRGRARLAVLLTGLMEATDPSSVAGEGNRVSAPPVPSESAPRAPPPGQGGSSAR